MSSIRGAGWGQSKLQGKVHLKGDIPSTSPIRGRFMSTKRCSLTRPSFAWMNARFPKVQIFVTISCHTVTWDAVSVSLVCSPKCKEQQVLAWWLPVNSLAHGPMVPKHVNLVVSHGIFTGHGVAMIHSDGTFETSGFTLANSMERVTSTPTPTDFSIFFRPCHFLVFKVGTVPVAVGHPHLEMLNGLMVLINCQPRMVYHFAIDTCCKAPMPSRQSRHISGTRLFIETTFHLRWCGFRVFFLHYIILVQWYVARDVETFCNENGSKRFSGNWCTRTLTIYMKS